MEKPNGFDSKVLSDAYFNYINSKAWAVKRTQRLNLDNYTCQKCGNKSKLEVHHINYARFGNENISTDLITLCQYCHEELEKTKGRTIEEQQKILDKQKEEAEKQHNEWEERNRRIQEEIERGERIVKNFIKMAVANKYDYSDKGPYNLCDYKQLNILVNDYAGTSNELYRTGIIRDYFYGKRCEKIKELRANNCPNKEIRKEFRFAEKQLQLSNAEIDLYIRNKKTIEEEINNE